MIEFSNSDISTGTGFFVKRVKSWGVDPKMILDLGSDDGTTARQLSWAWPEAQVFSYDPLNKADATEGNISFFSKAVGRSNGECELKVVGNHTAESSVFELVNGKTVDRRVFEVVRLEEHLAARGVTEVDLIFADIQGSELNAFVGLGDVLGTVKWVQMEVCHKPLWHGSPLFEEIDWFMRAVGFELDFCTKMSRVGGVWGDAIFRKSGVESA